MLAVVKNWLSLCLVFSTSAHTLETVGATPLLDVVWV